MTAVIQVGLEGFTFPELGPLALIDLAAQTGYTHVGVRLIDPATNSPTLTPGEARQVRAHARERGIALYGADIIDLEGDNAAWTKSFSTLAACGITRLSSFSRGADMASARRLFRDFVAQGRDFEITPHLEPVSYFGVSSIGVVADLISDAGGGGITLDTLHFGRAGEDVALLSELARSIPIWLQVCDGPPEEELIPAAATVEERTALLRHESIARRLPPGEGVCGVPDVVRAVRKNAPAEELVIMVEAPDHERVRRIGRVAYASVCREAAADVIARATRSTEDRT
ncbi:sugar phosphate isomerase/epimerase [Salinibacterium sp. ZJ450]|uniref:sugar phosphate isomerase/epimerase family protein n=1 Tax=Salinibacterium sp. ZJ450 TaxID=2708338 RepID=UPI00142043AB|nr:sugar phosphate isomerase/epimerase [Salinibacterium sp. ZJ450]